MTRRRKAPSAVVDSPLDTRTQAKAKEDRRPSVVEGRLKTYEPGNNVGRFLDLLAGRISRPLAVSMTACVHCGLCAESCHYFLTHPDDPTMTPVWKADQVRKIFKRHVDWAGRIVPWWVKAGTLESDEDLNRLKNIVFGTCSACRRCTYNCPMGVDTGLLVRFARGLLTELGIVPEGVFNVSRDQWETGNQMAVSEDDYLETLAWMRDEVRTELGTDAVDIPVDKPDCDILYTINPREIKFDPRSIAHAAKIFHLAGASWTMPKWGWDQTNFGLFSGDDRLGAYVARNVYEAADRLRAKRIVISECGHGYRSTRWEGYTWADFEQTRPTESVVVTVKRYLDEGRIAVDPARNPRAGDLSRFLQHRPLRRPGRGAAPGAAPGLRGLPRDASQPAGEFLLHGRRRPPVHGRIPAAAARGREDQGRSAPGDRRHPRLHDVPQLRRRIERRHQTLQAADEGRPGPGAGLRRPGRPGPQGLTAERRITPCPISRSKACGSRSMRKAF